MPPAWSTVPSIVSLSTRPPEIGKRSAGPSWNELNVRNAGEIGLMLIPF